MFGIKDEYLSNSCGLGALLFSRKKTTHRGFHYTYTGRLNASLYRSTLRLIIKQAKDSIHVAEANKDKLTYEVLEDIHRLNAWVMLFDHEKHVDVAFDNVLDRATGLNPYDSRIHSRDAYIDQPQASFKHPGAVYIAIAPGR